MKWRHSKDKEKINADNGPNMHKKQSVTSTTSMPFLRDDNLTFHRFTTDVSIDSRRPSEDRMFSSSTSTDNTGNNHHPPHATAATITTNGNKFSITNSSSNGTNKDSNASNFTPSVWTTGTAATSHYKHSYTTETNDFQYIPSNASTTGTHDQTTKSLQNGSTTKLMSQDDDQSNKQSKCSLFRGVIFCLCLNFTYANVVRFPRELERHGTAFLIPYFTILLLIGLPIILLEISLGQFLGQGSANSWRASPILKGASLLGRLASWLVTIWTSLQAVIAILYVGELIFKTVPFTECASRVRLEAIIGYQIEARSGQECMDQTFLTPVWQQSLYFALLTMGLIVLWVISMICTYSSKTLRRSIFVFGLTSLGLLAFQIGWNMTGFLNNDINGNGSIASGNVSIWDLWPFEQSSLADSQLWFNALVQVIFSTGIGFGVWPVVTGKFLYKGDAVRTSIVYMCFNVFIITLSVAFFMTQYINTPQTNSTMPFPELKPLTSIYDTATHEHDQMLARLIPGLAYLLVIFVSVVTIAICIYTASRFFERHPNYIMCIVGLSVSVLALLAPKYLIARLLDTQIVGILVICALTFDIISITWIYGAKNIYTDLEFSIGRPILKLWVFMWCIAPLLLSGLLCWWSSALIGIDLNVTTVPRWTPILISVAIIALIACIQVYQQVDYNCCSMIHEAAHSASDWGPADPIVRHAWKQWRSVCEDTGQKDFTLRRRGTRDYTHSIKKGQYSRGKYGSANIRKASTAGSSSPNYSGSIFEDSAIEEDVSVDKFPHINGHNGHPPTKPYRYSVESRKISDATDIRREMQQCAEPKHQKQYFYVPPAEVSSAIDTSDYHNVSKVEILSIPVAPPVVPPAPQKKSFVKNPMARVIETSYVPQPMDASYGSIKRNMYKDSNVSSSGSSSNSGATITTTNNGGANNLNTDHICWRNFSAVNSEEFSTEL